MTPVEVARESQEVISFLVESGLADDQNLPFLRDRHGGREVTFQNAGLVNTLLKEMPYEDSYRLLVTERCYCAKLLDGGLIQLMYEFVNDELVRHRLAYLPSPDLRQYAEDREIYEEDTLYAEVVSKRILPVSVRFEADLREEVVLELDHPAAHVTLGQFTHCRIPASSASTPRQFVEFVLRAFYFPGFGERSALFPAARGSFASCILAPEKAVVHVAIPDV
jgi:hypothetical protein